MKRADSTTNPTNMQNVLESAPKMQGEPVDIAMPKQKDMFKNLRSKAKALLGKLKGQAVENIHNGMQAQLSSDGITKMISTKAVNKSLENGYTKEEHFISVEHILELYKTSRLTGSEAPNNKSADVIAYHKFVADYTINHKPTQAKITIRETYQAGNRIYSLELLELEQSQRELRNSPTAR